MQTDSDLRDDLYETTDDNISLFGPGDNHRLIPTASLGTARRVGDKVAGFANLDYQFHPRL